jgi:hypothetical protein
MDNIIEEEFDIQLSVLKKRNKKVEQTVYVEYNRINNSIISISPIDIKPSNNRNLIQLVDTSELTNNLFNNKIPLSKMIIIKNKKTNKFELEYNKPIIKHEFDYIFATTKDKSFIHLDFDTVSKNIEVKFDYELFKTKFGTEQVLERELAEFPEQLIIYCIDKYERSRLFDSIVINTKLLFNYHSIRHYACWLPDEKTLLDNYDFLYYDNNQKISIGDAPIPVEKESKYKSNILYKQHGNVLKLQSNMQNTMSFQIEEEITLYSYLKNDPTVITGSYKVSRDEFNNYNYFEIQMKTKNPIRLTTNCFHLQIEESDVYAD